MEHPFSRLDVPIPTSAAPVTSIPSPESLPEDFGRCGSYRLRFARTAADVEGLRALRFDVFNLELGAGLDESFAVGRDADEFDARCHHLLVEDADGVVVGTYRTQTAAMAARGNGYYTTREYDLDAVPWDILYQSVEIGRGCTHRRHRKRTVHALLWQGLARYLVHNRLRYLFGSCSLMSQDPAAGIRLYRQLEAAGKVHPELDVPVRAEFRCEAPASLVDDGPEIEMSPLLATTLRRGALVCSRPALVRDFKTIDFLLLMDTEASSRSVRLFLERASRPPGEGLF